MCATVYDEIQEAASQGHTNLYLNYRKLSELPRELLELFNIQRLYLKRNVLKKLVRNFNFPEKYLIGKFIVLFFCSGLF